MKRRLMMHLPRVSEPLLCSLLIIIIVGVAPSAANSDWEINTMGTVKRIVDGDTLDAVPVGRVRLADIDTPEVGEPGAQEATDYLASLTHHSRVYLDVDDLYGTDVYNRIVAVVYVRHNATHLLNVNEALLKTGLADMADFPNEFDPATWTLYIHYPTEVSLTAPSAAVLMTRTGVFVMVAFAVVLVFLHFRRRRRPGGVTPRGRLIHPCPDSKQ
ncbi:MAG: thermonuclease family protein [Thermoplasmata archaeon]